MHREDLNVLLTVRCTFTFLRLFVCKVPLPSCFSIEAVCTKDICYVYSGSVRDFTFVSTCFAFKNTI